MPSKPPRVLRRPVFAPESLEGRLLLATQSFGNGLSMNIFEDFNPPTPAFRYPTVITVSDVVGPITEIRVSLLDVYHDRPEDLDILLVSPTSKSVLLMSDAGSSFGLSGENAVDLTFTDLATRDLPELARINSGVYRPTNYDQDDFFPGEVSFDAPTHESLADLATDNPNGEWRLYVVDDTLGFVGGVGGGWTITFITGGAGPVAPATPDLHPNSDRGASNSDNVTNVDLPVFRGAATAGTQVRLFVDGIANAVGPVTNGNYQIAATGLVEGTYNVSARAIDVDGNEGAISGEVTITIDKTPPDGPSTPDLTPESDTGASNSDDDTTDSTPTFTGTAPGALNVQLLANGLPVGSAAVSGDDYTLTPTAPLATGTYDFTVIATDLAGNNSALSLALPVIIRPGGAAAQVTATYVRGSTWAGRDANAGNVNFKEYLEAKGLGDGEFGFRVDNLAANTTLPWINLNQVVLRYSSAVSAAALPVAGSIGFDGQRSDYTVSTVTQLDPQTVVLTLNRALGIQPSGSPDITLGDQIRLTVPAAGPGGGNYSLVLSVLQGDADRAASTRVQTTDVNFIKARLNRNASETPPGGASYTPYADLNGDGRILTADVNAAKARLNDILPIAAAPALFGDARIAEEILA